MEQPQHSNPGIEAARAWAKPVPYIPGRSEAMIEFLCDSCSRVKDPAETWILGLAAEAVGVTAARREVTILPNWNREQALHPLGVHFCSEECKENYIEKLFGNDMEEEGVERIVTRTGPRSKTTRAVKKVEARKPRRRKRAA
jgi:hypothetical protein